MPNIKEDVNLDKIAKLSIGTITIIVILIIIFLAIHRLQLEEIGIQHDLLLTTFRIEMQNAVDDYYTEYSPYNVVVDNYSAKILNICKTPDEYKVKFGIYPYIGPHNTIGYDEIEFHITNYGDISLIDFSHVEDYNVPSHHQ